MAEIAPNMKPKLNTLSPALREEIMKQDVSIHTLKDLIACLERITAGD